MRIFLDAITPFSAARADGAVRKMLALTEATGHKLWADAYVFEEARRNLAAKTPSCLPVLNAMSDRINASGMSAGNSLPPDTVNLPEKDRPLLAAAVHHHCDLLVTGDPHSFRPALRENNSGCFCFITGDAGENCIGLEKQFEHDPFDSSWQFNSNTTPLILEILIRRSAILFKANEASER
ncbi:MAG: hypothetical protein WA632_10530 [Gallionella sp.]